MAERSDFWYRKEIVRYKLVANIRERFRKRQEARKKPRKKGEKKSILDYWIVRHTIEKKWFHDLPQTPEINLNLCGNGRRYIIKCYPGKSKPFDETVVTDLESAWLDYKRKSTKEQRQLVLDFMVALIKDAADAGHVHDLSDTTNRTIAGFFRGYKISYAQGKESPLADLDRSDPRKGEWIYRVHGSTIPYMKLWEDNRRFVERGMGTTVIIDQPEDCPDAIRIRKRETLKPSVLPPLKGNVEKATSLVIGREAETRKLISIPVKDVRNLFVIATIGGGKTELAEGLMFQLLTSLRDHTEGLYFADIGKKCIGLEHLEQLGAKFARTAEEGRAMIETLYRLKNEREAVMLADPNHGTEYNGKFIWLFIDETAAWFRENDPETGKKLIALTAESRAFNFRQAAFTQRPTVDFIPPGYLDNFDGRIVMRVKRMRTVLDFFGGIDSSQLEVRPTILANGEFIMDWPAWEGLRYGRTFLSPRIKRN